MLKADAVRRLLSPIVADSPADVEIVRDGQAKSR